MKPGYNRPAYLFLAATIVGVQLLVPMSARAQDIPTEPSGFTSYVAERMRATIRDVPVNIKAPLTLAVGSMQANLDRVYSFCKTNIAGCAREIDTYVNGVAEANHNQNAPADRKAIRLLVRTTDYIRRARGAAAPRQFVPERLLVEGLVMVPVVDSSRTIRMLNGKDAATLDLTEKQVYEVALANLRNSQKSLAEVAPPAGPGQIRRLAGDIYQPSRLALIDSWAPLARGQHDVLIVAIPVTDMVLYIGDDSPAAVDALRTLANNVKSRAPNPLSNLLLRWTPKGWDVVR